MRTIAALLALQLTAAPAATPPLCGRPEAWPASFHAFYDSLTDVAYASPSSIAFAKTKADGNVRFYMQLQASHAHRTSPDSAHLDLEFWMNTDLERGAIARAMYSVPDSAALRVTLDDSTRMVWLVVARRAFGERTQDPAASVSESMSVEAPAAGLARLLGAAGAGIELRGRTLHVTFAQLDGWRAVARWAWCPAERPDAQAPPRSPH